MRTSFRSEPDRHTMSGWRIQGDHTIPCLRLTDEKCSLLKSVLSTGLLRSRVQGVGRTELERRRRLAHFFRKLEPNASIPRAVLAPKPLQDFFRGLRYE